MSAYQTISDCLIKEFAVAPELVTPQATLAGLQLDSLALVELSLMVEERLGVTVTDIQGDATLAGLAELAGEVGQVGRVGETGEAGRAGQAAPAGAR